MQGRARPDTKGADMTTNHPTAGHTTTMVDGTALGAACGLHWACAVVNPALSIIGLLPTPQQRTTALLALLRAEVTRRAQARNTP